MNRSLYIICLFFFCIAGQSLRAQTLNGAWYGTADVETSASGLHNNYMTELVIRQKGNKIEGVFGYYFRDKYQSYFIHGHIDPKTHEVVIPNIPVIYFGSNSTVNNIDCNTKFIGVIINSRVSSTLKGHFYHDDKYKYLCPDLKVNYTLDRDDKVSDSVLKVSSASAGKIWKPQEDDIVVNVAAVAPVSISPDRAVAKTDTASIARKETPAVAKADTPAIAKIDTPAVARPEPVRDTVAELAALAVQQEKEDKEKINSSFSKRNTVTSQVLDIESDSVRLSFYDNGEIDGDSISVFVNRKLVLTHQELAAKALTLYLHLDSTMNINEVSMFAENLGKIPPNTALMVITDGKNRYEVFLSSSLTENATVQLRRVKKEEPK
jgi:hypothetical protein